MSDTQRPSKAMQAVAAANDLRSSLFARLVGLSLLAFGCLLIYQAKAPTQRWTGAVTGLVALALMLPAQLQTAVAILIGAGRSAGLIKTKHVRHKDGTRPSLGETVSISRNDIDRPGAA